MTTSGLPSKYLDLAVNAFARLPGIGHKTALRLVLHLLKQNESDVTHFGQAVINLRQNVKYCRICHNISDSDLCVHCSDTTRDRSVVCIVESIKDVMAIENTQQYNGLYHVLGGVISPMEGIGPNDLSIDLLTDRLEKGDIKELILALSTTMEGDTTNFYIYKRLQKYGARMTTLARGVAIGDELQYTDEVTLGRSIMNRTLFEA